MVAAPTYSQTDLVRKTWSQSGAFRFRHERKGPCDPGIRYQVKERRLLQLCRQTLAQRPVENGIAGVIAEIRHDDAVLTRERPKPM